MGIERIRNPEQGGGALLDLGNVFHTDSLIIFYYNYSDVILEGCLFEYSKEFIQFKEY